MFSSCFDEDLDGLGAQSTVTVLNIRGIDGSEVEATRKCIMRNELCKEKNACETVEM